jgi:hypothetical protein
MKTITLNSIFLITLIFLNKCNSLRNDDNKQYKMAKKSEIVRLDSISKIFDDLNWWMNQSYNAEKKEIESTGEAQAAIKDCLYKLDMMNVKYKLEGKKYTMVKK